MTKVRLNPAIEWLQGKMGDLSFRRTHTGELSLIQSPDMSRVKWSPAQKAHRQRFKQAIAYAKAAMANPDIRPVYEQMAVKKNKRPFDMAVSDYFQGNDLLLQKYLESRKKPSEPALEHFGTRS